MKKYISLVVSLALFLPVMAGAAEFRQGNNVSFGETIKDNLYVTGGTSNLAGTVEGDLYAAGGTINIMGMVTGDVVVVGGTVIVTGKVGGDLRICGGNITIGGSVGGEMLVGGGSVSVLPGVMIGKGLFIGAGNVNMDGLVTGDLKIGSENIVLGPNAKVAGNFDYYSQKSATISKDAKISGAINFHEQIISKQKKENKLPFFAFITFWGILGLVASVFLSYLMFYLFGQESKEIIEKSFTSPGRELVRGFALFFLMPIAAIICFITLIGFSLGFLIMAMFGVLVILGAAATGLIWAAIIAKFIFKKKETEINWWLIILAVVALAIIKIIPFVGWIIGFIMFLIGFGALSNLIYKKLLPKK
jgi:hypothetical protein